MRRTGIVLGILGACAGGVLAYADASPLWQAWHEHKRLQALLATPTVRRATGVDWFAKHSPSADRRCDADGAPETMSPPTRSVPPSFDPTWGGRFVWFDCRWRERSSADKGTLHWIGVKPVPGQTANQPEGTPAGLAEIESFAPDPNRDGIKLIRYGVAVGGRIVTSLELSTGERIELCGGEPCPVSFPRTFVVPLLFPLVGFLLPWGVVKTIAWVAAGFMVAKGA